MEKKVLSPFRFYNLQLELVRVVVINLFWIENLRRALEPVHKNAHTYIHSLRLPMALKLKALPLGTELV